MIYTVADKDVNPSCSKLSVIGQPLVTTLGAGERREAERGEWGM